MMFSSRAYRDLITYDGDVCLRCWGLVPREGVQYVPDDGSLCECDLARDVVQRNPPNPILVWHRIAREEDDAVRGTLDAATSIEWTLEDLDSMSREAREIGPVGPEHVDHARRVLSRLVRLSQGGTA